MKKTFKIGEYAKGGIIKVETTPFGVGLECRDYDTGKLIFSEQTDDRLEAIEILNDWTSSYYADEIISWAEKHLRWLRNEWRSA